MDKLLVTSVDGLLGANLAATLNDRCEVVGMALRGPGPDGCRTVLLDDDAEQWAGCILAESPRLVVHCTSASRPAWDAATAPPPDARRESRLAAAVAAAARRVGAQTAVITSDVVFAGPRMFHSESSELSSPNPAALAARAVEQAVSGPRTLVVRTHAYGWSPAGAEPSYAERMWHLMSQGEICEADADRHATPILASDLAELVYAALERNLDGVLHISGAERTSPFRFAAELALSCGFAGRQVKLPAGSTAWRRSHVEETSMGTHLARRSLQAPLPLLREGLARFAAQAENGYRARLGTIDSLQSQAA